MAALPVFDASAIAAAARPKVNFQRIAERAQVSPSTVDRVLNGRGNVSMQARQRVIAAARELGSQRLLPSAIDRTLHLDVVVPALGSAYEERLRRAVEAAARSFAIPINVDVIGWTPTSGRRARNALLSSQHQHSPLVLIGAHDAHLQQVAELKRADATPVVAIDCDIGTCSVAPPIGEDTTASGRLAAELCEMWSTACSDVLVIGTANGLRAHLGRYQAFQLRSGTHAGARCRELLVGRGGDAPARIADAMATAMPRAIYSLLPDNGWIDAVMQRQPARTRPRILVHDCTDQHMQLLERGAVSAILEVDVAAQLRYALAAILNALGETCPVAAPGAVTQVVLRENSRAFADNYRHALNPTASTRHHPAGAQVPVG